MATTFPRKIRSFVMREGRTTKGQQHALDTASADVMISSQTLAERIPQLTKPLIVEIGFGNGANLITTAKNHPEDQFLGIEVYTAGVGNALMMQRQEALSNLWVIQQDATEVFQQMPKHCIDGLKILFPDPWHKKKHHKRRLIQAPFIQSLIPLLKPQGFVHIATDWQPYATWIEEAFLECPSFIPAHKDATQPAYRNRIETKFERRGLKRGHQVTDLLYILKK